MKQELTPAQAEEEKAMAAVATLRRDASKAFRQQRSLGKRVWTNLLHSRKQVRRQLEKQVGDLVAARDRAGKATAEKAALERASGQIQARLDAYILSALEPIGQAVSAQESPLAPSSATFEFKDFEVIFPGLLEAARNKLDLEGLLVQSVANVTLAGLARILGLDEVSLDAIIDALLTERCYDHVAPLWGGSQGWAGPRHSLIVLPPISDRLCGDLEQRARERQFSTPFVRASCVSAGAAVVALEVYEVKTSAELTPPLYRIKTHESHSGNDSLAARTAVGAAG